MTITITKQIKIKELRQDMNSSIRKIAKKLLISKTTVVKYLKLFSQGYNPDEGNTRSITKEASLGSTTQRPEIIQLPTISIEDISENDSSDTNKISNSEQMRMLDEENKSLTDENDLLKEQLARKDEENNSLKVDKQHSDQQLARKNEENRGLKEEKQLLKEQLTRKEEENKKLSQLNQKQNDDVQIKNLQAEIERIREDNYLMQVLQLMKEIQFNGLDKNEMQKIIQKAIEKNFFQTPPPNIINTEQKESTPNKPQPVYTFKKIDKPDLEVKKSSNIETRIGIDPNQILARSVIAVGKSILNGLNDRNQIIL